MLDQPVTNFNKHTRTKDGLSSWCRKCVATCVKNSYKNNKEKILDRNRKYQEANKEKLFLYRKEYRVKNKAKLNEEKRIWKKNKRKTDPIYKLGDTISRNINRSLKGSKNGAPWEKLVGYSLQEFKAHLESKFTKGMTWENYGKFWHIDHIIPLVYFKYDSADHPAFKACWALSNLQPLWATTEIAVSHGENKDYVGNLDKNKNIVITKEIQKFLDSVNI